MLANVLKLIILVANHSSYCLMLFFNRLLSYRYGKIWQKFSHRIYPVISSFCLSCGVGGHAIYRRRMVGRILQDYSYICPLIALCFAVKSF